MRENTRSQKATAPHPLLAQQDRYLIFDCMSAVKATSNLDTI
jgi:hypothetical protein